MSLYDVILAVLFWGTVLVTTLGLAIVSFGVPIAMLIFAVRYYKEKRRGRALALLLAAALWLTPVALYFLMPWGSILE
jgi:hypothetical protein